ncbi:MAG: hypothetical protein ACQETP_08485, partial [Bacteroidota bacterium]
LQDGDFAAFGERFNDLESLLEEEIEVPTAPASAPADTSAPVDTSAVPPASQTPPPPSPEQ